MCNNMAESQKHFPQLHKPDKNVHSFLFHIFEIPQNTVAEGSRLIPKELKRSLGCDRKDLSLYCDGYTGIYICQNSSNSTF